MLYSSSEHGEIKAKSMVLFDGLFATPLIVVSDAKSITRRFAVGACALLCPRLGVSVSTPNHLSAMKIVVHLCRLF